MNLDELRKLIRTRWITVLVTTLIALIGAVAMTLMTTPLYQSTTKLFVSTAVGSSASDLYQANRLSQERVLSYTELLMGKTLAQRTVERLDLDMTSSQLQAKVTATTKPDTVLIDVEVLDESPVRARDIADALSDEFVAMVRELETPRPGAEPDARVVVQQRAAVASSPAVPDPIRNIAAGLALGGLLGVGLAILRDRLDNTVKSRETLEEITHVGMVGNIPLDKDRRRKAAITFENNSSGFAEALRKLRTNLQFLKVDQPPRVIVVISSIPAEGKSTTAVNIALALAEAEYDVVLVDGDMRRPTVAKNLDLVGAVGFSTVVSGSATLAEALQPTKFPRLTALTSGATPPNPSELLGSQAAKMVIRELRDQFDYVIIDCSPLLAVTDGAILSTNADGALIMVQFGETKREQLAHAVTTLDSAGATLLGAVFTMTPTRGHSYYNYSYNYYGEDRVREHAADAATPPQEQDKPTSGRRDSEVDLGAEPTELRAGPRGTSD